jgi:neopullulanase
MKLAGCRLVRGLMIRGLMTMSSSHDERGRSPLCRAPNPLVAAWLSLILVFLAGTTVWSATPPSVSAPSSETPRVDKVEPPNWWIGLSDPMLMITGENLAGARVSTKTRGIRIIRTQEGREGRYLFVWLKISAGVAPGEITLQLATATGQKTAAIPLQQRNPAGEKAEINGGFNGFSPDDVIYLIMPDRFDDGDPGNNFPGTAAYDRNSPKAYHGGDLRGIEKRLPYLKDLGVTTIWMTPIFQNDDSSGASYHGYGATDLYAVEKRLGTLEDYRSLVKAAHELGMKIVLDCVPNHIGVAHPWVEHPPTDHWLHGSREHHIQTHYSFVPLTDPHSVPQQWRDVVEGWFVDSMPDMGTDDPIAAQYLLQNAMWWLETGAADGLRLDTFPYVNREFWRDFHAALHHTYPHLRTVGEAFYTDPTVTAYFVGGKITQGIDTGVDTVFDFPLFSTIRRVVLENASAKQLEEVLRQDWLFPHPENLVTFLGNHDTRRFMGEAGATPQRLKLAFSLLLTMRGIPQIYSGDEIGMPGGDDPDNRRDFPGGFPGDARDAFTPQGRTPAEQEVFEHVRNLLRLRRDHPALRQGELFRLASEDQTYAFVRLFSGSAGEKQPAETLLMVMNNADQVRTIEFDVTDTPIAKARSLVPLEAISVVGAIIASSHLSVSVPARSLVIYRVE